MPDRLRVLFLCTGNSCRSQMAEAWARALHPDRLDARSAGTRPGRVDPRAVQVMREVGVDLGAHRSKHVNDLVEGFDWVVTVCDHARESCPVFHGAPHRMHTGFDDPPHLAAEAGSEEQALEIYRRVRDEIRVFVTGLPDRLEASDASRSDQ